MSEQVAKVNPDLVARDAEGKPFTVRYNVNAMLLNEFLKEHRKGEAAGSQDRSWKQSLCSYNRRSKRRQRNQKVTTSFLRKPAPRVVAD